MSIHTLNNHWYDDQDSVSVSHQDKGTPKKWKDILLASGFSGESSVYKEKLAQLDQAVDQEIRSVKNDVNGQLNALLRWRIIDLPSHTKWYSAEVTIADWTTRNLHILHIPDTNDVYVNIDNPGEWTWFKRYLILPASIMSSWSSQALRFTANFQDYIESSIVNYQVYQECLDKVFGTWMSNSAPDWEHWSVYTIVLDDGYVLDGASWRWNVSPKLFHQTAQIPQTIMAVSPHSWRSSREKERIHERSFRVPLPDQRVLTVKINNEDGTRDSPQWYSLAIDGVAVTVQRVLYERGTWSRILVTNQGVLEISQSTYDTPLVWEVPPIWDPLFTWTPPKE
jgi:hypothetical protein